MLRLTPKFLLIFIFVNKLFTATIPIIITSYLLYIFQMCHTNLLELPQKLRFRNKFQAMNHDKLETSFDEEYKLTPGRYTR